MNGKALYVLFGLKHPENSLNQRGHCHQSMYSNHRLCSAQLLEGLLKPASSFSNQSATSYCSELYQVLCVGCCLQ